MSGMELLLLIIICSIIVILVKINNKLKNIQDDRDFHAEATAGKISVINNKLNFISEKITDISKAKAVPEQDAPKKSATEKIPRPKLSEILLQQEPASSIAAMGSKKQTIADEVIKIKTKTNVSTPPIAKTVPPLPKIRPVETATEAVPSQTVKPPALPPRQKTMSESLPVTDDPTIVNRREKPYSSWAKPQPQRTPSEFERKAAETLRKAWNWLIVGEEFRRPGTSVEYAIATTWLVRAGILIILCGIAFFLKYSIDRGILPPIGRVSMAMGTGISMLVIGLLLTNKKYHLIGLGLTGGGIATLYFSVFAAFQRYHLIDAKLAFGMMIIITLTAGVLAVRLNALLVAIFGVVGGYITPILLSTGTKNLPGLYSYLLLLGFGTLFIARYKYWKLLNVMSFTLTYLIYIVTLAKFYKHPDDFIVAITFGALFFLLFACLTLIRNIIRREKITVLELIGMTANLAIFLSVALWLTDKLGDMRYGAIVTLALALFYMLQIAVFVKIKIKDRNLLLILFGLASFTITLTFPLLLSGKWITAAWAIQAFIFLWLSHKMGSRFLRQVAYIIYAITFGRLILIDMQSNTFSNSGNYLAMLLPRMMTMGLLTLSTAAGFLLLKKERDAEIKDSATINAENKTGTALVPGDSVNVFFWVFFIMVFALFHVEFIQLSRAIFPPLRLPLLSYVWLGALLFAAWKYFNRPTDGYRNFLVFILFGLLAKFFITEANFWNFKAELFIYGGNWEIIPVFIRAIDALPIIALLAFISIKLKKSNDDSTLPALFGTSALGLLFIYTTIELNSCLYHFQPTFRLGGISVLWGVFALGMIIGGVIGKIKALRLCGLALFTITAFKIFLFDLQHLSTPAKIIAFIALGVVMLAGAFVYIKFKESFNDNDEEEDEIPCRG
jgi:uncharacterized membrane protein